MNCGVNPKTDVFGCPVIFFRSQIVFGNALAIEQIKKRKVQSCNLKPLNKPLKRLKKKFSEFVTPQ